MNLNLKLAQFTLHRVKNFRLGFASDTHGCRGLVDQVDCGVWQSSLSQIASGEVGGGDDGTVKNRHTVVDFVLLLQSTQDRDGLRESGLLDQYLLETTLESCVLLDILAVFGQGSCADTVELTTGKHGLEQVGGVHATLARAAGTHEEMNLVNEQDDHLPTVFNLLEHTLHALFKLSAVFGAGNKRTDIQTEELACREAGWNVGVDDSAG